MKVSCAIVIYYLGISDVDVEGEEDLGKLDIESVGSDVDYPAHRKVTEDSTGENIVASGNSAGHEGEGKTGLDGGNEKNGDDNCGEEDMAKGIRFSLTTDVGLQEDVEIYDYDKRGRLETLLLLFFSFFCHFFLSFCFFSFELLGQGKSSNPNWQKCSFYSRSKKRTEFSVDFKPWWTLHLVFS